MSVKVRKTKDGNINGWHDPLNFQSGARQIRGFFDSILKANPNTNNGLRQWQNAAPTTSNAFEQLGSFLTGTPARKIQKANNSWGPQSPQIPKLPQPLPSANPIPDPTPNGGAQSIGDLTSFLAKAMGIMNQYGGSTIPQGPDYGAMRQQLQNQAGQNDARLAAMYKQLQGSYANDAPGIAANYDTAIASSGKTADQAAALANSGYDAARNSQTQQFQQLGIGDAAKVLAANGSQATADQGRAVSNIAQNKAAVQQQLGTEKANAGNYNTSIEHAAGLEGNLQRAVLQNQLAQKLAELSTQQSASNAQAAQAKQANFAQALQLAQSLYGDAQSKQSAQVTAAQNQQKTLYQQYRDQQGDVQKKQQVIATLYPALLKQNGGDEKAAKQALVNLGLL